VTPDGLVHGDRPVLVMLAAGMAKRYGGCKPLAPVGLHGEAVIDLTASDALAAGFGDVVLVLGPSSGAAIRYHVQRCWPAEVAVSVVEQTIALGTAHAVLCARSIVGRRSFAVVNADDVYGSEALHQLAQQLSTGDDHALVGFRLQDTVVSDDPVTRGTVVADDEQVLRSIVERRRVTPRPGGAFAADDGLQPVTLGAGTLVSMNLWGFQRSIWSVLEKAVRAVHPDVGTDGTVTTGSGAETEVLLPEVIGSMVKRANRKHGCVRVLVGTGPCIGVTHADDLPVARIKLAELVGAGRRPEWPWESVH
jgi:UTP-glucose-1-phosphate uridylyltransferase